MADATGIDLLINDFQSYLVTPANAFGLGGFLFDIEGETTATLTTEITDHYLEDNSAIQDHIAVRPKKFTLKGYVGEVVYRQGDEGGGILQAAVRKLTTFSAALPVLADAASQIKAAYDHNSIGNLNLGDLTQATNFYAVVKNLGAAQTKQAAAYSYFKALMEQKILVSLQTPFEFVANMAVESIIGIQQEYSKYITDFSIVLKQIRTVSELSVLAKPQYGPPAPGTPVPATNSYGPPSPGPVLDGRAAEQAEDVFFGGNMDGQTVPGSALPVDTIGSTPPAFGPVGGSSGYNKFIGGTVPLFKLGELVTPE